MSILVWLSVRGPVWLQVSILVWLFANIVLLLKLIYLKSVHPCVAKCPRTCVAAGVHPYAAFENIALFVYNA